MDWPNPPQVARDLGVELDAAHRSWLALTTEQRIEARAHYEPVYRDAGWTGFCEHPTCPPWSCEPDHYSPKEAPCASTLH